MIIKNNNNREFSSPTMPDFPIWLLRFDNRFFCFKKSIAVGSLELEYGSFFGSSIGFLLIFSSIEKFISSSENKIGFRLFNNSINISFSCNCKVSLMSLFGNSIVLILCFLNCSEYFLTASFPASSLSKQKIISSNFSSSKMAFWISSFSPFVP